VYPVTREAAIPSLDIRPHRHPQMGNHHLGRGIFVFKRSGHHFLGSHIRKTISYENLNSIGIDVDPFYANMRGKK